MHARIESGELVRLIFADPNQVVLSIDIDSVDAGELCRRFVLRHLPRTGVDPDQFACTWLSSCFGYKIPVILLR